MVLGPWLGLPALRVNSTIPCGKCRHKCDICDGSGKKQCEGQDCGGRGWIGGDWMDCPGPGCKKDTGQYKPDCVECQHSQVRGLVKTKITCPMCLGVGRMTCSRCKGTGKFSTGKVQGSIDYRLPACKACDGTGYRGTWVKQDVAKFTNAKLIQHSQPRKNGKGLTREFLVLGPIHSLALRDWQNGEIKIFDVLKDEAGDFLVMLVPAKRQTKPQKAYLVGGIVRERTNSEQRAS